MKNKNEFLRQTKEHFDTTADDYDHSFDGRYVKPMYEYIFRFFSGKTEGTMLDLGCGTGNVLIKLVNGKRKLYGIDLSEKMVAVAQKRLENQASILTADARQLPFEDNFFDILLCNASFHHYPHPRETLMEMKRVMKEHGRLLIGEMYAFQPFRLFLNLYFRMGDSGDYHSYGKHEMEKLLRQTGFIVTKVERRGMRIYFEATLEGE